MPFCGHCGTKLPDNSRFCLNCGAPCAHQSPIRASKANPTLPVVEGSIVKCPNCGSNISNLDAVCPYCGAHIARAGSFSPVEKLVIELSRIDSEAQRMYSESEVLKSSSSKSLLFGTVKESFDMMKKQQIEELICDRKVSLIRAFPIPNTVEGITEFMLLADASIDVKLGKNTLWNKMHGKGSVGYAQYAITRAWIDKMDQAYKKAKIAFPNDPAYSRIQTIYRDKMKQLNYEV